MVQIKAVNFINILVIIVSFVPIIEEYVNTINIKTGQTKI